MTSLGQSASETLNFDRECSDAVDAGVSLGFSDSETQFFSNKYFDTVVGDTESDLRTSKAEQGLKFVYVPETRDELHQELIDLFMSIFCSKYAAAPSMSMAIDESGDPKCYEPVEVLEDLKNSVPNAVKYTLISKCGSVRSAEEEG